MATTWFIQRNEKSVGPLSAQQLRELAVSGRLRGDDLVRKGEDYQFTPARGIKNLFAEDTTRSRPLPPSPRLRESQVSRNPVGTLKDDRKVGRSAPYYKHPFFVISLAALALMSVAGLLTTWRNNMSLGITPDAVDGEATAAKSQSSDSAERSKYDELPDVIRNHARTVQFSLADAFTNLRQPNHDLNDVRLAFSSTSQLVFVLTLAMDRKQQTLRLFRSDTGVEVTPDKSEIDYFSFPAILSPDESQLACCDGDFLRIWKLNNASATLLQSITLPDELEPVYGYRLSWKLDATLVVSARPGRWPNPRRIRVYHRDSTGAFETTGTTLIAVQQEDSAGNRVEPIDAEVAADGKYVMVISKSKEGHSLRIKEVQSGREIRTLSSSGTPPWGRSFPSAEIALWTENQQNGDGTTSLQLSPRGDHLLVSIEDQKVVHTDIYRTSDWHKCGRLPDFTPLCFSHDGSMIAGYTASEARTSRGIQVSRTAVAYKLGSGESVLSVNMGEAFGASMKDRSYLKPNLLGAFSEDDSKLTMFHSRELDGWNNDRDRAEAEWVIAAWDLKTGKSEFLISRVADKRTIGEFSLSSTGKTLFNSLVAWDVPHIVEIDKVLAKADQLWDSGRQADVLPDYASVITDSYQWFVEDELGRAYCRSLDALALADRIEDGRTLITAMEHQGIDVSVETGKGKSLVSAFNEERAEAARRYLEEQRALDAARLAEVRQANQATYRPASTMTKREFVQKMDQTKSMGAITTHGVNVVYEDNSFQDVFGEPDSEITSGDFRKLLHFRCADGMVQLRAVIVNGRTMISEINYY